ncbi:hypothetical protein [Sphingomonas sp. J315]|uniref:hypothetical protein n=1 Tax=Sphingomonas sp. J315 TaxID=2898433 RepID=UPI0021ADBDE9|nr:hypothetical protein [Sphingomonas sp. J315]UUY00018.1 hypothetical protein LRS08_02440 [Sphingomonas sp. J315]
MTGPRPFNRRQAHENAAFLAALRRTGNAREAARSLGFHRSTMTKRRARDPAFAAEWDAALVFAHANLNTAGQQPDTSEPRAVRTASSRMQLRALPARALDRAAEQAFLSALSATANVRLSAAAAGFSHSAFYARRRQSPAFAREMQLALETGYERVELALMEAALASSYRDDAWRHNDPPAIPSMTADEAMMLLRLHHQSVRLQEEPPHLKRRRGESSEAHSYRLSEMYKARLQRARDAFDVAEAERRSATAATSESPFEEPFPTLPALDQVKGWRKGKG